MENHDLTPILNTFLARVSTKVDKPALACLLKNDWFRKLISKIQMLSLMPLIWSASNNPLTLNLNISVLSLLIILAYLLEVIIPKSFRRNS